MKKKHLFALLMVLILALSAGTALADGGVTRYYSSVLHYSGTGWGGWSCPAGTVVVGGGYTPSDHTVLISEAAKPGSASGLYPVYPHYTYTPPEEGWVVQNGGVAADLVIYVDCMTPSPAIPTTVPGAEVVFNAWLGTADDGSWCALESPEPYVGVEVQSALCFPETNPEWVATNAPCYGPVYDNNTWVCDHLIGGSGNRLDVDAWRANIHN